MRKVVILSCNRSLGLKEVLLEREGELAEVQRELEGLARFKVSMDILILSSENLDYLISAVQCFMFMISCCTLFSNIY